MKKNCFVFGLLGMVLVFSLMLIGCFSIPSAADLSALTAAAQTQQQAQYDALNRVTDFSTLPERSGAASQLEGVWQTETLVGRNTVKIEYTFTGNQFVLASDGIQGRNHSISASRGIFTLTDSVLEIYYLEQLSGSPAMPMNTRYWVPMSVNATSDYYENTGLSQQGFPAHIATINFALNNGQLVLSAPGEEPVAYTKQGASSIQYQNITAQEKAREFGITLGSTETLIVIQRITETGLNTRIGEPEDWHIYIDGAQVQTIKKQQTIAFAVPNGIHTIYVSFTARGTERKSREITFPALASSWVPFAATMDGKASSNDFNPRGDKVFLNILGVM
jgi:hypothetical protein